MIFIFISFFLSAYFHLPVTSLQRIRRCQALLPPVGAEVAVCGVELREQWLAWGGRGQPALPAVPSAIPQGWWPHAAAPVSKERRAR